MKATEAVRLGSPQLSVFSYQLSVFSYQQQRVPVRKLKPNPRAANAEPPTPNARPFPHGLELFQKAMPSRSRQEPTVRTPLTVPVFLTRLVTANFVCPA